VSKKMHSFCSTFCIILGANFFISFSVLKNIKNEFLTQIFQHNSCYLSNDSGFSKNLYVFTHLWLFEWKTSSKSGILHIKLKWDNELICNIWLSTSSNLLIVWMILKIYLHFAIYQYNYIFFNHLISTSKWDLFYNFFFGFWNTLFQVLFIRKCFNINLVEVQKHVVSKLVFVTIIFDHCNVFSP
jgi:hypothetical protein